MQRRRERATRSGTGAGTLPTCKFFRNLQFLRGSVSATKTITNVNDQELPDPNDDTVHFKLPDISESNHVKQDRNKDISTPENKSATTSKIDSSRPGKKKRKSTQIDVKLENH